MLKLITGFFGVESKAILLRRAGRPESAGRRLRPFPGATPAFPLLAVISVILLAGCQKEDIRAYRIPKEPEKSAAAPAQSAEAASSEIICNPPAGWVQMPPGPMRQALFAVKGSEQQEAQVSIVVLPGQAGGELDNVNRWRGQVKLASIKAEDLKPLTEEVEIAGAAGHLFDIAGAPAERPGAMSILAAILEREGNSWFFKMMGHEALVKEQKSIFKDFLKGVRFRQGDNPPLAPAPSASSLQIKRPANAGEPRERRLPSLPSIFALK